MKPLAEGTVIKDKYRLDREIATGGMGALWLGFDLTLKRRVAVKFIRSYVASKPQLIARFEREAQSMAQVRSINVVATFDYGVDRGCAFIVLEHLEGEDLSCRLQRQHKLSVVEALTILKQLTRALDAIHAAGIIHRDLKPANIFLAKDGGEEVVKVLDFGVAKAVTGGAPDTLTETGMLLGTLRYMSPEQTKGAKHADHRSDLWSAGVILYRALTGVNPIHGVSNLEILDSICRRPIPRASELAPELPAAIDEFFARALARDPDERFQSGREMADALFHVMQEPLPESMRSSPLSARSRAPQESPPRAWPTTAETLSGFAARAPSGEVAHADAAAGPVPFALPRAGVGREFAKAGPPELSETLVMPLPPHVARDADAEPAPVSAGPEASPAGESRTGESRVSSAALRLPIDSGPLRGVLIALAIAAIGLGVVTRASCAVGGWSSAKPRGGVWVDGGR